MKKIMTVFVSTTDRLSCFGDSFFDESEAEKLIAFAKEMGYEVHKNVTEEAFADYLNPLRKRW